MLSQALRSASTHKSSVPGGIREENSCQLPLSVKPEVNTKDTKVTKEDKKRIPSWSSVRTSCPSCSLLLLAFASSYPLPIFCSTANANGANTCSTSSTYTPNWYTRLVMGQSIWW